MILVFGGTTEGKQVVEVLATLQLNYVYSTKTEIPFEVSKYGNYRFGAFSEEALTEFIQLNKVSLIINASHPFASVLHTTVASVGERLNVGVLRLEREYPLRMENSNVKYVNNYSKVLSVLNKKEIKPVVLALTGVQSIAKLKPYWKTTPCYFRILDRQSSVDIAMESNFPKEQLILGMPNVTVEEEIKLIKKHGIEMIVTKESGASGMLSIKIEAALQSNIPIIILKRPALPSWFALVYSKDELKAVLKSIINKNK